MKHLQKNIRRIAILLCALFVLLASYGAYSISTYGNRWFASSANTFARAKKKDVIAGSILVNYFFSKQLERAGRRKKLLLLVAVAANILLIAY